MLASEHAGAMHEANDIIREEVERWLDPDEKIAFVCECDDGDCYRAVWLTRAEYDELRADHERVLLARAHESEQLVAGAV